jgi:hypothetical protein
MAMAAAASSRALCACVLTGNQASASRPLLPHRACRITRVHDSDRIGEPVILGSLVRYAAERPRRATVSTVTAASSTTAVHMFWAAAPRPSNSRPL